MWFNVLKQPQLSMGGVGLVDLSNVPEEDPKCKPKFLKMIEKLKKHFEAYPALESWNKINHGSSISWEIYRKDDNTPLASIGITYDDSLEDSEYCEILETDWNNSYGDTFSHENLWLDIWETIDIGDIGFFLSVSWDIKHKDMDAVREATLRAVFNILEGAWN